MSTPVCVQPMSGSLPKSVYIEAYVVMNEVCFICLWFPKIYPLSCPPVGNTPPSLTLALESHVKVIREVTYTMSQDLKQAEVASQCHTGKKEMRGDRSDICHVSNNCR